ncbi:MAG: transposase family protein [Turicibacter sp.]|nr:transposase family protein [Turicibacter sp.]
MIIAHDFKITLEEYAHREIDNDFPVFDCCPKCGCHAHGNLYKNGFYTRHAKTANMADPILIWIRRMRCKSCKGSFSVLPSFLIPYFQNCVETVLEVLRDYFLDGESKDTRQARSFYKKRFLNRVNWIYSYLNEAVGRFGYPKTEGEAASVCLKKIFSIGCQKFFLASWGYMDSYLMAR